MTQERTAIGRNGPTRTRRVQRPGAAGPRLMGPPGRVAGGGGQAEGGHGWDGSDRGPAPGWHVACPTPGSESADGRPGSGPARKPFAAFASADSAWGLGADSVGFGMAPWASAGQGTLNLAD